MIVDFGKGLVYQFRWIKVWIKEQERQLVYLQTYEHMCLVHAWYRSNAYIADVGLVHHQPVSSNACVPIFLVMNIAIASYSPRLHACTHSCMAYPSAALKLTRTYAFEHAYTRNCIRLFRILRVYAYRTHKYSFKLRYLFTFITRDPTRARKHIRTRIHLRFLMHQDDS